MKAESSAQMRENIEVEMRVLIQRKRIEATKEGIVTWIEDQKHNEDGIEVEIDNYFTGNVKKILKDDDEIISIQELLEKIEKHESNTFEMKASFKYDLDLSERLGKPTANEVLKRKIVEEAAGFMNTNGGMICIGVDNEKNIIGLEHDFELQSDYHPEKDRSLLIDTLKGEIEQTFNDYLDDDTIWDLVRIVFVNYKEKEICCIKIDKSPDPMFVKIHGSFRDTKLKKDKQGGEIIWKCWIRTDTGLRSVDFDSFLKIWVNRQTKNLI